MERNNPGPAGQKGLRGQILLEVKRSQPVAVKELAESFGVSANAVRRHLLALEAEGLIEHDREQRGNGAPTHAFRLSPDGEALFPKQYEGAVRRLLEHIVEKEGRSAAAEVFAGQYQELRHRIGVQLDHMTPIDRLRAVAGVLQDAGFMAELGEADGETRLKIHNCAIKVAAECLPEVCDTELTFLQDVVDAPIERGAHIMDGCNACEYALKGAADRDIAAPPGPDSR